MSRVYHNTLSYVAMVSPLHNNVYDYSETVFTKMNEPITVICKNHGAFYPVAGNHKKTGCPTCYENRRGVSLRMKESDFISRLAKEKPSYSLVSEFVSGSDKVTLRCSIHKENFQATPIRVFTYENTCPMCDGQNISAISSFKTLPKALEVVKNLPSHITCVSENISWGGVTRLSCSRHGEFDMSLKRVPKMEYVCHECSKEHWQGVSRVSCEEYASKLVKLFPNPPFAVSLDVLKYSDNVGTKTVALICAEHGPFTRHRHTVNNGKLGTPCPYCKRHGLSTPELELVEFIRTIAPCVQGSREVISPKEIDCWVPTKKVAVEMCGLYWHSNERLPNDYHLKKTELCIEKGVRLIHVFQDEWDNKRDICKSIIRNALGVSSKVYYARKLTITRAKYSEVKAFFNENHMQGSTPAQRYLVLKDSEKVVAAASFSYSRLKKDNEWELVRYCSLLDTTVVGGLSRLVKNFLIQEGVTTLISYCNRRFFTGKGYEAAGFEFISNGAPTYYWTNKIERYTRYRTQKHKLEKFLLNFDASLSESSNMEAAGFNKIYDCGSSLYRYSL